LGKDDLVRSAKQIPTIKQEAADAYGSHREKMVALVNEAIEARADVKELVGEVNLDMMRDNHANHARFIESLLGRFNAEELVDTVLWVFSAYRSRGFHDAYWSAQLNTWLGVLRKELPREHFDSIEPLYQWLVVNVPQFVSCADKGRAGDH